MISLSDEVSNKRPLENGFIPNYKARKISAVRDFPRQCSSNALSMNLKPGQTDNSSNGIMEDFGYRSSQMTKDVVINGVGIHRMADAMESGMVVRSEMSSSIEADGLKIAEMPKLVELDRITKSEMQNIVGRSDIKEYHAKLVCRPDEAVNGNVSEGSNEDLDVDVNAVDRMAVDIGPLGIQLPKDVEFHTYDMVNNPVKLEGVESFDAPVGKATAATMDGILNSVEGLVTETKVIRVDIQNATKTDSSEEDTDIGGHKMSKELNKPGGFALIQSSDVVLAKATSNTSASVTEELVLDISQELPSISGCSMPVISIRLDDKYRQRSMSIVREFPLHCGHNVSLPAAGGKEMPTLENSCAVKIKALEMKTERKEPVLKDVLDGGAMGEMVMISSREFLDELGNIHIKKETTESLKDGRMEQLGEMKEAIGKGGFMPFEACDHSNIEKMESGQTVAVEGASVKNSRQGPVGIDTVFYSSNGRDEVRPRDGNSSLGDELQREVVIGLMAAPSCPWKKAKVALNESDGRASGLKLGTKKSSRQQKSKALDSNSNLEADRSEEPSLKKTEFSDSCHATDRSPDSSTFLNKEGRPGKDDPIGSSGKNSAVYPSGQTDKGWTSQTDQMEREIVHALVAACFCKLRKGKVVIDNLDKGTGRKGKRKQKLSRKQKSNAVASERTIKLKLLGPKKKRVGVLNDNGKNRGPLVLSNNETCHYDGDFPTKLATIHADAPDSSTFLNKEGRRGKDELVESSGKNIVYPSIGSDKGWASQTDEMDSEIMRDLVSAHCCKWGKEEVAVNNSDRGTGGKGKRKQKLSTQQKGKAVANEKKFCVLNDYGKNYGPLVLENDETFHHDVDFPTNSPTSHRPLDFEVTLPPFGPNSSGHGDARHRVRDALRAFHTFCRKILQQEEAKEEEDKPKKHHIRIDLISANMIKSIGKEVYTEKQFPGQVPGVEVGDEFQYRAELAIVGIHRPYQSGIDWMKLDGVPIAISIVTSGAYADDVENSDVLKYSGQGGNITGKDKNPEDQKLERGNLALSNCIAAGTPVRVVRGWKQTRPDPLDPKPKLVSIYIYDGLYTVKRYWTDKGTHGKSVFMFELMRNPGQPELAWKELKRSNTFKTRQGACITDISGGKEPFPICAVNTLDDEKPPPFNYIAQMMHPEWYRPIPPAGCNCTGKCSRAKKCACAFRNGGEIPYNRNGAIVETKPLVYECGPHCKCPPSCYNKVTQCGIKYELEIFKTETRGWGVRPLTSIPSGGFICEYAGELLEDKEAEQKIGSDEYLFDIGQKSSEGGGGYTIDAGQYGNVGRFINHSCSPNLYAQNVIYDNDESRMPHVMLFAMENIPPLKELTYHYNYLVDQIYDSDGNVKVKKCFCGSAQCSGRMY